MNIDTKAYGGIRDYDRCCVQVFEAFSSRDLDPRLDLFNHSPTGFEWGYGGSGPAQLALAILADALGDEERALHLHQKFKFAVIGKLPHESWGLTHTEVMDTVRLLEQRERTQ
jgi:hypothetical protein